MDAPTQKYRVTAVSSPLGEDALLFHRMTATEELGRLFEFQIEVLSNDDHVDFNQLLGQNMTVRMDLLHEDKSRYLNGYVCAFSQIENQGNYAAYQVILRPWFWFLTRTADCRIFQNATVPDIIKQVFADYEFADVDFTGLKKQQGQKEDGDGLQEKYREREYCVQYRESDFDFISRLLEEEGIYYYFRHDNGKHTLMLVDSLSVHQLTPGYEEVPYFRPDKSNRRPWDSISEWSVAGKVKPGAYTTNDFDFKIPRKKLLSPPANMAQDHAQADYEVYDYPGKYVEFADGNNYARVRIEELQSQHEIIEGRGTAMGLQTGALFKLARHHRKDFNREYLLVSTSYEIVSNEYASIDQLSWEPMCQCSFTAIDARQQFRPARSTPKPIVRGPQTATVVGKAGEEIWTDQYGRVKCQFHWDRYGQSDQESSCWIRVSHAWAGKNWGGICIPRIGQEVIVDFLEGDPDQPIVTGRVYNGANMPPYKLPENAMISGVKSNSTKGGGGYNELYMDDSKGKELINTHAQYDMKTTVQHDDTQTVHNNRVIQVDGTHTENIVKDTTIAVTEGNYSHAVVKGTSTSYVKGAVTESYDTTQQTTVKGSILTQSAEANIMLTAATQIALVTGDSMLVLNSDGTIILSGKKLQITGTQETKMGVGTQNVTCNTAKVETAGAAITAAAVGVHEVTGALVKIN